PRVQIFLGDPAAGGQVLLDKTVTVGHSAPASVAISATLDTTGLLGPQQVVVLIDPDQVTRDGNRANNRAQATLTINADTKPDLSITDSDLSTTPAPPPSQSSVTLRAVVHNNRTVAATGAHIAF